MPFQELFCATQSVLTLNASKLLMTSAKTWKIRLHTKTGRNTANEAYTSNYDLSKSNDVLVHARPLCQPLLTAVVFHGAFIKLFFLLAKIKNITPKTKQSISDDSESCGPVSPPVNKA